MLPFRDSLRSGPVLLMDGAMATELFKKGLAFDQPAERWNIERPDAIREVHESYLAAGANCILTNTFQANPKALAKHGLEDRLEEIVRAAVQNARQARGPERYVLASIGPTGKAYEDGFLDRLLPALEGVDAILLETFGDVDALWLAKYGVLARLAGKDVPVLVSLSFSRSEAGAISTLAGQSADAIGRLAAQYGIAALGLNCGGNMTLADATAVMSAYRQATDLPLFARPSAGMPVETNGELKFPISDSDFASWVSDVVRAGVRMVGGCCGTTPDTIAAMQEVLERWSGAEAVW